MLPILLKSSSFMTTHPTNESVPRGSNDISQSPTNRSFPWPQKAEYAQTRDRLFKSQSTTAFRGTTITPNTRSKPLRDSETLLAARAHSRACVNI